MESKKLGDYLQEIASNPTDLIETAQLCSMINRRVGKHIITHRHVKTKDDIKYLAWQEHPDTYNRAMSEYDEKRDKLHSKDCYLFLREVAAHPNANPRCMKLQNANNFIAAFGSIKQVKDYAKVLHPKSDTDQKFNANDIRNMSMDALYRSLPNYMKDQFDKSIETLSQR